MVVVLFCLFLILFLFVYFFLWFHNTIANQRIWQRLKLGPGFVMLELLVPKYLAETFSDLFYIPKMLSNSCQRTYRIEVRELRSEMMQIHQNLQQNFFGFTIKTVEKMSIFVFLLITWSRTDSCSEIGLQLLPLKCFLWKSLDCVLS